MNWLIIILLVVVIAFIGFQYFVTGLKGKWSQKDIYYFQQAWRKIKLNTDQEHRLLEADKLFDHMLKKKGYNGSLGEKLKKHGNKFSNIDEIWKAHKLRNKLAHEVDVKLSSSEVDGALRAFKKGFADIGLNE
jgi:hypothetical protein